MFSIRTARLILRDLEERDLQPYFALASDPIVTRYQSFIRAERQEQALEFIRGAVECNHASPRTVYNLAIIRGQDGAWLGWIGMGPPEDGTPDAVSFGYGLHPQYWGKGYMTEAVRGLIDYTFRAHDVEKMLAECEKENPASARVMEKAGMQLEITTLETDPDSGVEHLYLRYCIDRGRWRAKYPQSQTAENLDEYRDPRLYDLENPDFDPEGSFYLSLAAEFPGSVLELGCGTGRITIPYAQRGFKITGLDLVPEMLERAKEKAGDLPIHWVQADARDFHLGRKFSFIFENGAVFMHMLTNADQEAFLARVREHLAPGGRFVVSLAFPHPGRLQTDLEEKDWYNYADEQGRTVRVSGTDAYDELRQVKTETAVRRISAMRRISAPGGVEEVRVAPLQLRYTFPQEMERLLDQAGLAVMERYGGPDRSPLTGASEYMLYVCALKTV